jgi:pSer/pThr/pTyr-binding forkhead associated (FHA) protein
MIVCPNCTHLNPEGAQQCEACYTPLPEISSCDHCGAPTQSDANFCGQCGADLKQTKGDDLMLPTALETGESGAPSPFSNYMIIAETKPELESEANAEARPNAQSGASSAVSSLDRTEFDPSEFEGVQLDAEEFDLARLSAAFNVPDAPDVPDVPDVPDAPDAKPAEVELAAVELVPETPAQSSAATAPTPGGESSPSNPPVPRPLPPPPPPSIAAPVNAPIAPAASTEVSPPASRQAPTQLQLSRARLVHLRSDSTIDLPSHFTVLHLGKPNDRVPPDLDLSGYADSEVVSRVHADIRQEGEAYFLEDVGSANGTYVNNQPLLRGNRHRLRSGDRISFGKGDLVAFVFQAGTDL